MPSYHCPDCGKITRVAREQDAPYRPFCSERCQLVDLHHWFEGDYCISDPLTSDPDALPPDPPTGSDNDAE